MVAAAAAVAAPAAIAANGTVPLLTGGELTTQGTASATFQATSPSAGGACGTQYDTSFDENAQLTWKTSFLTSIAYGVTPLLPSSDYTQGENPQQAAAEEWTPDPGSGHSDVQTNHVENNACVHEEHACDESFVTERPTLLATWYLLGPLSVPPVDGFWQDVNCSGDQTGTFPGTAVVDTGTTWQAPVSPAKSESASIKRDIDGDEPGLKTLCDAGGWQTCSQHLTLHNTVTLHCVLCVRDIRFEEPIDPDEPDAGRVEVPANGAYDGNRIHIVATVYNTLGRTLTSPVRFYEAKTHRVLAEARGTSLVQPVTFKPGANRVDFDWDSSGFSWESGKPFPDREIELTTALGGGERAIRILPKPVVLVHGWNSDATTWDDFKAFLREENPDWRGYAVGDGQAPGVMQTDMMDGNDIFSNAQAEADYVQGLRLKLHAAHVDLVAHSMGGLISRAYINSYMPMLRDGTPPVSHLVMLGTPNLGSPCAAPLSTILGVLGFTATPTWQLRKDFMAEFNRTVTKQKGVAFSVLAGDVGVPTCDESAPGDLVVAYPDAWSSYLDVGKVSLIHTHLITNQSVVSSWVRPHLARDPGYPGIPRVARAAKRSKKAGGGDASIVAARKATLRPGRKLVLPVRITGGSALEAIAAAPPNVSITLVDPRGKVAAKQAARSEAADSPMRFASAKKPRHGRWKIVLEEGAGAPVQVEAGAAVRDAPLKLAAKAVRDANGHVTVTATLKRHSGSLKGEKLKAVVLDGQRKVHVTLRSQGTGRWSGRSAAVKSREALVVVRAAGHAGAAETSAVAL